MKNVELFVVRTQDPDAMAENLGAWRARRYLSDVIGDIATAVRWVASHGFDRVVISADHGHMMLPEIPAGDVVQTPPGGWMENKRRCRLGSGLSKAAGTITLKAGHVGIQGDVQEICLPIGFRVFEEGEGYFHGGLSLQEAMVPVVVFRAGREKPSAAGKPEIGIRYRSDKFTSRVIGLKFHLQGDMFGTAARVRIEAYDGAGAKAKVVGEAADCEARDEKTREVTLAANKETPVPVLVDPDFDGAEIEMRVSDPRDPLGVGEGEAEKRDARLRRRNATRRPGQESNGRFRRQGGAEGPPASDQGRRERPVLRPRVPARASTAPRTTTKEIRIGIDAVKETLHDQLLPPRRSEQGTVAGRAARPAPIHRSRRGALPAQRERSTGRRWTTSATPAFTSPRSSTAATIACSKAASGPSSTSSSGLTRMEPRAAHSTSPS